MATGNRHIRVGEAMREILATEVQGGLRDPGLGMCTVTAVDVTRDLRQARVFVSIYGDEKVQKDGLAALRRAAGYLRSECARELRLKFAPELEFKLDVSIERGARVEDALRRAREEDAALARLRAEAEAAAPSTPPSKE